MYPGEHAKRTPHKAAVIMAASGDVVTYAELDERSTRLARLWREAGLRRGDHVALLADNTPRYFEVYWAAIRSGLYLTAVNRYLSADEASYIVNDCGAKSLVVSAAVAPLANEIRPLLDDCPIRLAYGGDVDGYERYEDAIANVSAESLGDQPVGTTMLYSSGTTGRPKGIKRPLPERQIDEPDPATGGRSPLAAGYGMTPDSVYLSPAPLYHAAPLAFTAGVQALGGTVVVMEKFDPVACLEAIERHKVTHAQFVPTMFVRMLKLDDETRLRYDVSSLQVAIHAAAPCPVEVKRQMIEWWGPILSEYYAGTEGNGSTRISSEEWLAHPGSVGRAAAGTIHICDDLGNELPIGEAGTVYFEQPRMPFEYHGDPEKTRNAQHPEHPNWSTLGDIGYLDEEGYLYLTDRKAFMIISGGVNIYPQEIEDALILHPKVGDVAAFGIPHDEMGEEVKAVVEPAAGVEPSPELERELIEFARSHIAHYKVPRSIDFIDEMPRLPTGKLYKRVLRDAYVQAAAASGA
ncbi:MAG TPA: acyl-CoA synthetase [Acidimicrobiales bacterium]|nr:acyl-CoA synthetase [Acidimicrobiales bacterium]